MASLNMTRQLRRNLNCFLEAQAWLASRLLLCCVPEQPRGRFGAQGRLADNSKHDFSDLWLHHVWHTTVVVSQSISTYRQFLTWPCWRSRVCWDFRRMGRIEFFHSMSGQLPSSPDQSFTQETAMVSNRYHNMLKTILKLLELWSHVTDILKPMWDHNKHPGKPSSSSLTERRHWWRQR